MSAAIPYEGPVAGEIEPSHAPTSAPEFDQLPPSDFSFVIRADDRSRHHHNLLLADLARIDARIAELKKAISVQPLPSPQ